MLSSRCRELQPSYQSPEDRKNEFTADEARFLDQETTAIVPWESNMMANGRSRIL